MLAGVGVGHPLYNPPVDYERSDAADRYAAGRHLSNATQQLWLESIAKHVDRDAICLIVDIGSGTGRLTCALARYFNALAIGVEPGAGMRERARRDASDDDPEPCGSVEFVGGAGESIPLDDASADLVFLSMVWHHLSDRLRALEEIARVLRSGRWFVVRTPTVESVASLRYLEWFPDAAALNAARLPGRDAVIREAQAAGFRLVHQATVRQRSDDSLVEYAERVATPAYSDLAQLPAPLFERGLAALRRAAATDTGPVDEDLELFVFTAAE